jgi:hypothetical protein
MPRDGQVVMENDMAFDVLLDDLKGAVSANKMGVDRKLDQPALLPVARLQFQTTALSVFSTMSSPFVFLPCQRLR